MHLATDLLVLAAAVTTGLVAGLLYVFAHAVMPGLGSAEDQVFVAAFQRIDAAIGNPWMMVTFLGSPVLTVAALVVDLAGDRATVPWLVAALTLVIATVLVTGRVHLPLNRALAEVDTSDPAATAAGRRAFETPWVRWNVVRTVTSTTSFIALAVALLVVG
jgi:uncharacterized membrane protein